MKHIKKFNETFEMDPRTIDIEDIIHVKKIENAEELNYILNDALANLSKDFEGTTKKISDLVRTNPEIKIKYKKIYDQFLKKWKNFLNNTNNWDTIGQKIDPTLIEDDIDILQPTKRNRWRKNEASISKSIESLKNAEEILNDLDSLIFSLEDDLSNLGHIVNDSNNLINSDSGIKMDNDSMKEKILDIQNLLQSMIDQIDQINN
jgi:hypothetical protein